MVPATSPMDQYLVASNRLTPYLHVKDYPYQNPLGYLMCTCNLGLGPMNIAVQLGPGPVHIAVPLPRNLNHADKGNAVCQGNFRILHLPIFHGE